MAAVLPARFELEPPDASTVLIGQHEAEGALLSAHKAGRLHHAWLLEGPEGGGKATLAFRFARFLLRHPDPAAGAVAGAADLSVSTDEPVYRQVRARSHPDLFVLERPRDEEGKATAGTIPVSEVRRLARFLSTTSSGGGWRVIVVDTADDLLRSSANALLKMLEEPPGRTVFLLLSATPGRLLPTIRSRCRRLALAPLSTETICDALARAGIGADVEARRAAASLSGGSLGRAAELAGEESIATINGVFAVLDEIPRHDPAVAQSLAERLGRRGGEDQYHTATALIGDWIAGQLRQDLGAGAPPAVLARWAEVWEKVTRVLGETERLNLDRTQALLAVFRIVSAAASQDAARV